MPPVPIRRHHLLRTQPFTFSHFAHFYVVKRKIYQSKSRRKSRPNSEHISSHVNNSCNGYGKKHSTKEKSEQSYTSREEIREQADSSDKEDFEGVVQADFAFFDPKPDDFHGVKVLLQTYLDYKLWDLSGFVDLILGQPTVGTVVKIEGDEDDGVYAVVTALNLQRYKDHKCMTEVEEFLLKKCQDKIMQRKLSSFFGEQSSDVALLISQRVVNLPPQLLPPMYEALFDEVSWATEDEPTEDLRRSFCFKIYLMVTGVYKHKNADHAMVGMNSDEEAIIYVKAEDEIFHELSSWSCSFPLHTQRVAASELKNYRWMGLVMAVEASKVSTFREQLRSFIEES